MASKNNRNSPLKNIIKESINELHNGNFPDDERLEDSEEITGAARFAKTRKTQDEIICDELFAGNAGQTGMFVMLEKEVAGHPGQYMSMEVIENDWRQWADIDASVLEIVRRHTRYAPKKWGTGLYRIRMACKGGSRGATYPRKDVYINADEETLDNQQLAIGNGNTNGHEKMSPEVAATMEIEKLRNLVDVIGSIVPKPPDPNIVQQQMAEAYKSGLQVNADKGNDTALMIAKMMESNTAIITALISSRNNEGNSRSSGREELSGMLGVMRDFGVLGGEKPKTVTDTLRELKEIGFDPFKKEDPLDQMSRLRQLADLAMKFTGMKDGDTEKPSVMEQLIQAIGPAVPTILQMVQNNQALQAANANPNPMPQIVQQPTTVPNGGGGLNPNPNATPHVPTGQTMEQQNAQAKMFFNALYNAVKANDVEFYKTIYTSLMQDSNGVNLIRGIVSGVTTESVLIEMLQTHSNDPRFRESDFVMKHLVGYMNRFMQWVKQQVTGVQSTSNGDATVNPGPQRTYDVQCNACKQIYSFDNEADWKQETNKACDNEGCLGILEPYRDVV